MSSPSAETSIGLASGLIGAVALGTSFYNVYLQRQQVRAAVWPHVEVGTYCDRRDPPRFKITLRNPGVGPATIRDLRVTLDGRPVHSWRKLLRSVAGEGEHNSCYANGLLGSVVKAGDEGTMIFELSTACGSTKESAKAFLAAADTDRINVVVCYCSTLDDCWRYQMSDNEMTPQASCVQGPDSFGRGL